MINSLTFTFVSSNKNKIHDFELIARDLSKKLNIDIKVKSFQPKVDVEENGTTTLENATLKLANASKEFEGAEILFTEDTAFFVAGLDNKPGILAHRWGGDDPCGKVLSELKGLPFVERYASYECTITYKIDGVIHYVTGQTDGYIADKKRGDLAFGYDQVFVDNHVTGETVSEKSGWNPDKSFHFHRIDAFTKMVKAVIKKLS